MKKIIMLMCLFVITGCASEKKENVTTPPAEESVTSQTEEFKNENYVKFPEVKNIVSYLKIPPQEVTVVEQVDDEFVFGFKDNKVDNQDESDPSINNYVKILEEEGYKVQLFDGTTRSAFVLEKDNYEIKIYLISDMESWKNDVKDELNVEKLSDENTVYKVSKKN